jgi:hypothetical protein
MNFQKNQNSIIKKGKDETKKLQGRKNEEKPAHRRGHAQQDRFSS